MQRRTPTWSPFDSADPRRLRIGGLRSRETILVFSPPRTLSHWYESSMSLEDYRGDAALAEQGGKTQIPWPAEFTSAIRFTCRTLQLVMTEVLRDVSKALARAAQDAPSAAIRSGR
jgi:hypothetical protein